MPSRSRWGATFLAACHLPATKLPNGTALPERYVGLIGEPNEDHSYWGRPEEDHVGVPRKAYVWQRGKHAASDMLGMVRFVPLHFLCHREGIDQWMYVPLRRHGCSFAVHPAKT